MKVLYFGISNSTGIRYTFNYRYGDQMINSGRFQENNILLNYW